MAFKKKMLLEQRQLHINLKRGEEVQKSTLATVPGGGVFLKWHGSKPGISQN